MRERQIRSVLDAFRDLSHAVRSLRARPAFALAAVFSLALGIGANSAIFSVLDGLFLRPPGVEAPGELLRVYSTAPDGSRMLTSLDDFDDLAAGSRTLGLAAEKDMIVSLRDRQTSQYANAEIVSLGYFGVLRPEFVAGRPFARADFGAGAGSWPAVVGHAFWKRQFDGDPAVVGRQVLVEGFTFTVLGVLSERFRGMDGFGAADVYLPLPAWKLIDSTNDDYKRRDARILTVWGRPRRATSRQVESELLLLAGQLAAGHPDTNRGVGLRAVPDPLERVREAGTLGGLLAVAISLVLLMSCVNVANLLLAQADRRRKELAIRLALGAGRMRLVRQLLAESLLLSLLGAAAGLALAAALVRVAPLWPVSAQGYAPRFEIDSRVVAFSLLLAVLTALLFGLAPAWRASSLAPVPELKAAAANGAAGRARLRGRSLLVVGQLAATLVLLTSSSLMVQSLRNLVTADLGFPRKDLLTVWVHSGTRPEAAVQALLTQWAERVKAIPGVKAVTMARRVPLCPSVGGTWTEVSLPGSPLPPEARTLGLSYNAVEPGFLETLGIPLVEGRGLSRFDTASSSRVAVVNQTMARRFWPGASALGQTVILGGHAATVVGVARDTKVDRIEEPKAPYFYVPRSQDFRPFMTLVVEAAADPLPLVRPIRAELAALAPELSSGRIITLAQALRLQSGQRTSVSLLIGGLGLVGLTLAIVGLYGIVAYAAGRRAREIGIRVALGARPPGVLWLVLRQGMLLTGAGLALGLAASPAATRLIGHMLFGVGPADPAALAGGALLLAAVAAVACLVPAHRAARVDPMVTLRTE
jgi:predicted permease